MEYQYIGKPVIRQDAYGKVTGETRYMSDLKIPGMLWGRFLRSPHAHALIKRIDTSKAKQVDGVHAVVTHEDVPGLNAYGGVVQDQPVFCRDKVRLVGDFVAGVAAETKEIADKALELIEVEYELLPGVFDPEEAAKDHAPRVHEKGNIHLRTAVEKGDVEKAFNNAHIIVERVYHTPRQMHAYLETESGVAFFDDQGNLNMLCGSQYSHRDQIQLARILNMPEEKIKVTSNPMGGAFGGKDDLTIQGQLAILALKSKRPVKVVYSREESVLIGQKKHPMKIYMKTAAARDGTLLANEVKIYSDTGAYATLGGPVLNVALENCCSAYRMPNIKIEGLCVYTNNMISAPMRGFGANQSNFAMETQIDIIAHELGLDPMEIRLKNGLRQGDEGALGHTLTTAMGTIQTLEAAKNSELWRERGKYKANPTKPWKKRGIGLATGVKGVGYGRGLPDYGACDMSILENGNIRVAVGCPELGQGNTVAYSQMAAEALGFPIERIEVVTGHSHATPDSRTSTASRSIYAGGGAILIAAEKLKDELSKFAAHIIKDSDNESQNLSVEEMVKLALEHKKEISVHGHFDVPLADKGIPGAFGLPHLVYSATTHLALVEVDTCTGQVEVIKAVCALDAGRVINIQGLEGQSEGGTVMGMGYALLEDIELHEGKTDILNFNKYLIPTALDVPEIETIPVEVNEATGPFGAKGVAEGVCIPISPAITNAIYDAIGVRIETLPATLERVQDALKITSK
ncbi:xanthine dehydrogenase family protein molybdopterin-binding subunit [Desulfitibacter alkalitolerans]|uniref:xanthine dehydrogenase family protein molybdopterin-binding subunit n=1 Tax=Desulfitibacter alkalitolerans TaxID=264641 RepID=UPI0004838FAF|nr:molybdopterin cofactor-binding domain-containing protein [Desulfitibacter alkalitolerans]